MKQYGTVGTVLGWLTFALLWIGLIMFMPLALCRPNHAKRTT